jgi:hypothetical protein
LLIDLMLDGQLIRVVKAVHHLARPVRMLSGVRRVCLRGDAARLTSAACRAMLPATTRRRPERFDAMSAKRAAIQSKMARNHLGNL